MLPLLFFFLLGLILICLGGDRLVHAAVSLSTLFGIPQIVIGATVVSVCTTLPEILVSCTAISLGSASICVGNAVGSILCDTGLIAGISLLVRPSGSISRPDLLWRSLLFFAVLFPLLWVGLRCGFFGRPVGIVLLLLFVLYVILSIRFAGTGREARPRDPSSPGRGKTLLPDLLTLLLCALLLYGGSDLLVDNGILLAEALGVPERVLAVTAIALGTSLPELVTTILSLIRKSGNLGLGNVLGANLLNLLLVIGIPAAFTRIGLEISTLRIDLPLALLFMLILTVPTLIRRRCSRLQGALLLFLYGVYCLTTL